MYHARRYTCRVPNMPLVERAPGGPQCHASSPSAPRSSARSPAPKAARSAVARMIALLRQAASHGCDLVVFPECALTAFFPHWYYERQDEHRCVLRARDAQRRDAAAVRLRARARHRLLSGLRRARGRRRGRRTATTRRSSSTRAAASSASTARFTCPATPSTSRGVRSRISRSAISRSATWAFRCSARSAASSAWRSATTAAGPRPIA